MPFTESDLRAVLRDRSDDGAPTDDVLDAVRLGARRHARRGRIATAVAASLVTAAIVGLSASQFGRSPRGPDAAILSSPTTAPATTAPSSTATALTPVVTVPGLSATDHGGTLVAGGVLQSPHDGTLTVTFVAGDLPVHIFTDCQATASLQWTLVQAYNGNVQDTGCSRSSTDSYNGKPAYQAFHVARAATVTLDVSIRTVANPGSFNASDSPDGVGPLTPAAQRPQGTIRVGVYEGGTDPVQPSDPPLSWQPLGQPHAVDARTVGANGSFTMTVTFGSATRVNVTKIAPGAMKVYANGVRVVDFRSLPSTGGPAGASSTGGSWLTLTGLNSSPSLHIRAGETVTLRIDASGFTSPGWQVIDEPNG